VIGGDTLNGVGDQFARTPFAFRLGLLFDLADDPHHVGPRVTLDLGQQQGLGLLPAHARDPLQLFDRLLVQRLELVVLPIEGALPLVQRLIAGLDLLHALVQLGPPALQPLLLAPELASPPRGLDFGLVAQAQSFVARAQLDLARLAASRFENALGFHLAGLRRLALLPLTKEDPDPNPDQQGDQSGAQSDSQRSTHVRSSLSPSGASRRRCTRRIVSSRNPRRWR